MAEKTPTLEELLEQLNKVGSSAEFVGDIRRVARQRLDFLRHASGVQWVEG